MAVEIVKAFESFPTHVRRTIFLAGPTPRSTEVPTWRPQAIALLESLNFQGHVFVPETDDPSKWKNGFEEQEAWEDEGLHRADIVVFWVPRDFTPDKNGKPKMPAGTTNIEFGEHMKGGRLVLGCPSHAAQVGAMKKKAERYAIPVFDDLGATLACACRLIGDGAERVGGECSVPQNAWEFYPFREWVRNQQQTELLHARVVWRYPLGNHPIVHLGVACTLRNRETGAASDHYLTFG